MENDQASPLLGRTPFASKSSMPFDRKIATARAGVSVIESGTYGASQGPRLETAAEIDRMEGDGCHMVGMTGMPEAALARELDFCYATCAVSANRAAGRGTEPITMEMIDRNIATGLEQVRTILKQLITSGC